MRICIVPGCVNPHDAKGYCHVHYNRWKRYGDPLTPLTMAARGSGHLDRKGYRVHEQNGVRFREHVAIAERAFGRKLPPAAVVHHADENPHNNAPGNLVICPSVRYHKLLHTRIKAMNACGNPNWRKCSYCGKHDDTANMRGEQSGRFVHVRCRNDFQTQRLRKKFGEPETVESRAIAACGHANWRKCWICKTYSDTSTMKELRRSNGTGYFYHQECHKARSAANYLKRKRIVDVHI